MFVSVFVAKMLYELLLTLSNFIGYGTLIIIEFVFREVVKIFYIQISERSMPHGKLIDNSRLHCCLHTLYSI